MFSCVKILIYFVLRKLVALCGMLVAHLDLKDKKGILGRGMKHELAKKISDIFATLSLNSDDMFIEMSLLQPSWLSQQVIIKLL